MKKFIDNTNQNLLEKYPTVWNTKIVWMLLTAFLLHIVFFTLGYFALANPELLQERDAKSIFFDNGTVFISIILSILTLVVWLIYLFKNNAFKSFYPTTRLDLFKQFLCYLIIVFCSTTFFLSYNAGLKQYISSTYPDNTIQNEIHASNKAAIFFSQDLERYTLNQRRYPEPFNSLYCEVFEGSQANSEAGDTLQNSNTPNLKFLDYTYRFYTLKSKQGALKDYNNEKYSGHLFYKTKDTLRTYFYMDSIFDASRFLTTVKPSYFNYSSRFYQSKDDKKKALISLYDEDDYYYDNYNNFNNRWNFSTQHESWNKEAHDVLKRNNADEIKSILADFLTICNQYNVKHNLTSDAWFDLVYHPENFELKALIRKEPKSEYGFNYREDNTALEIFKKEHITDFYLEDDALHYVFENIEEIKSKTPYIESIHFFIWLAFFFSSVIFMFRITGLKPLLFTIIITGVVALFITLLSVLFAHITGFNDNSVGYFVSYLTLLIGAIILAIPIFYSKKIKKRVVAICLNMSIIGFILFVFLIISVISLHQSDACTSDYGSRIHNSDCFNLLGDIGLLWSYILFIINLIFIYFYSGIIKNWKALPEG